MPSDWANLPTNLLDSIVERFLSSSDYVRFSLVCMSWFSVAKHNQSRFAKKMLSHPEPPMLLFFNNNEAAWNLYSVVDNKVLDVQSKMPKRRFCGSSKGWLVHVEQDFTITLTKPVFYKSNNRGKIEDLVVRLPELNPPNADEAGRDDCYNVKCEYYVMKAIITGDPISDADNYTVALLYLNQLQVAFIRPSKDTTWTYPSWEAYGIRDVLQYGGDQFYVILNFGNLFTFNISSKDNSEAKSLACGLATAKGTSMRKYLVDNGKDLLMVDRHYDYVDEDNIHTRFALDFQVFEFNFDKCKWIEMKTLGEDVALFIGENMAVFVTASNFPGCKQNCIYYNHDLDRISAGNDMLHDFGVYDMETKSISTPYSKHLMELLALTNQRPIWFTPSIHL